VDRRPPGCLVLSATRPLIEAVVRRRLAEVSGITVLDGHEVTDLAAADGGRAVRGVAVRPVDDGGPATVLDADLVVDASGRGSHAPAWLSGLGHRVPQPTTVDPGIAYVSRLYRIPDAAPPSWRGLLLFADPGHNPRSGYLFPVEGGRWMVALIGAEGVHAPTDDAGYAAYARQLHSPVLADALAIAEPLTDARLHRGTSNRRWHFERMRTWPERFVVLGDAACAFDPVYGQGMTSAVLAAEVLDEALRRSHGLAGVAHPFQRALARKHADPWTFATAEDLRYPATTGGTVGPVQRARRRYLDRLEAATTVDPVVGEVYARALGMLERPTAVLRPRIVLAALRTRPRRASDASLAAGAAQPAPPG
jgi:2-polyprenyl-6-methoxyphenol hydroxylase-like FAD-dependent oxidoreductase